MIFLFTMFALRSGVVTEAAYNVNIWYVCIVMYTAIIFVG